MSTSKKDPKRANKGAEYGKKVKEKAAKANTPKTNLIPQTEWQSDENLDLRGDLAEVMEVNLIRAYESLQKVGQALQQVISMNYQVGKVKMNYMWNNGEAATAEEVENWKAQLQFLREEAGKREALIKGAAENDAKASQTGLVTTGGQPLTEENLEAEKEIIA